MGKTELLFIFSLSMLAFLGDEQVMLLAGPS